MSRTAIPTIQNLALRSEQFANAAWTKNTGVTVTDNTADVPDPNGGATASKLVYDGSGTVDSFKIFQVAFVTVVNRLHRCGLYMRTLSGTKGLLLTENASTIFTGITVTSTWQQFTTGGISQGAFAVQVALYDTGGANSAFTVYLWGAQITQANRLGNYVQTVGSTVDTGPIRCSP